MKANEIVAKYGSPAYVYDLAVARAAYQDLFDELPVPSRIYYSLKSNPYPGLVRQFHKMGAGAEISSEGELDAVAAAGVPPEDCLYSGPGKSEEEIAAAIKYGIRFFSVESAAELAKLGKVAAVSKTHVRSMLRFNPDGFAANAGLVMSGAPTQFGADESTILANSKAYAGNEWSKVVGLHCYLGSNLLTIGDLIGVFSAEIETAIRIAKGLGIELEELDLGGGFHHPYAQAGERPRYEGLRKELEGVLDELLPLWRQGKPRLIFESGRYLSGGTGTLFGTVLDAKTSKGREFAILDFGINHFGGMAGLRKIPRVSATIETHKGDAPLRPTTLTGPLCSPLDVIVSNADLPPLVPGDLISIPNVGAYGLSASLLGFLSHRPPLEALLDGETLVEVSQQKLTRDYRSLA